MLSFLNPLRGLDFISVLVRLLLACACGMVIGLERSAKNRPAGFRTHILVCFGAASASLTGIYLYVGLKLPTDIARISASVISGLGFIGAGSIIVTKKLTIKGLTTAAGLWVTGIIGIAIGSGYYEGGILGTLLILFTETVLSLLDERIVKRPQFNIRMLYNEKESLDEVLRFCKDNKMLIENLQIQTLNGEESKFSADVTLRSDMGSDEVLARIRLMPGIDFAVEL